MRLLITWLLLGLAANAQEIKPKPSLVKPGERPVISLLKDERPSKVDFDGREVRDTFELKGDTLGAHYKAFETNHRFAGKPTCDPTDNPTITLCSRSVNGGQQTVADADATVSYMFVKDQLASILATVKHDDYSAVRSAMIAKYGKPTKTEQHSYQNAFGASFVGEVLTWHRKTQIAELREFHESRDQSLLVMHDSSIIKTIEVNGKIASSHADDL